jgi:hypothetical protein
LNGAALRRRAHICRKVLTAAGHPGPRRSSPGPSFAHLSKTPALRRRLSGPS